MAKQRTTEERFWRSVDKRSVDECWNWLASCPTNNGYGLFRVDGKKTLTHRYSWTLHNGSIPNGMIVMHRCDNPKCVNPAHLSIGTPADNAHDRDTKNRAAIPTGEKHGCHKLTDAQVIMIRTSREASKVLAERYSVSSVQINNIKARRNWSHLQ
jgi:hypothetical protein